ncbi:MAG: hypothetical protein WA742_14515 [Candidatus Cybelea sp.]
MKQMSPTAISRMIAQGIAAEMTRSVRCEAHDAAPTITIVQAEADGLEYAISGCCDDLRKRTRQAIDDLLGSNVTPA